MSYFGINLTEFDGTVDGNLNVLGDAVVQQNLTVNGSINVGPISSPNIEVDSIDSYTLPSTINVGKDWDMQGNDVVNLKDLEVLNIYVDKVEPNSSTNIDLFSSSIVLTSGTVTSNNLTANSTVSTPFITAPADLNVLKDIDMGGNDIIDIGNMVINTSIQAPSIECNQINDLAGLGISVTSQLDLNNNNILQVSTGQVASVLTNQLTSSLASITVSKDLSLGTNSISAADCTLTGQVSTPTLTGPNPSITVGKDLSLGVNSISGTNSTLSGQVSTPTLTSAGSSITVPKYLYMTNVTGGPLLGKKISIFETSNDWQYAGMYLNAFTYGHMLPGVSNFYLFSAATGAASKQDIFALNGTGGMVIYQTTTAPGTNPSGNSVYVTDGLLYSKDSSGSVNVLSKHSVYLSVSAAASTSITTINVPHAIQAGTWSATPIVKFTNVNASGSNLVQYGGSVAINMKFLAVITTTTSAAAGTQTLEIWRNPTFTGIQITGGTSICRSRTRLQNSSDVQNVTLSCVVSVSPGDQFSVSVASTNLATTNSDLSFRIESL